MLRNWLKRSVICLMALPAIYLQGYSLDGFYVKAGLGYSWPHHPKATCSGSTRSTEVKADAVKVASSMPWIAAVGYRCNEHWRSEISVNYRNRMNYRLKNDASEEAKGRVESLSTMLNLFFEFSKLDTMIPYVGAGIGCAWNKTKKAYWSSLTEGGHRTVALTWMATAGLREEISKGIWVDGAYRYTNMGRFRNRGSFDDGTYGASIKFKRLYANEVVLSLIFDL